MIRWLLFPLLCFVQSPRGALYTAEKQAVAKAATGLEQRDALDRMHADFPENSRVVRNLALQEARLENRKAALELLRLYAAMGGALDLKLDFWAPLREAAREAPELARNEAPVTHGSRLFRLKDSDLLTEDVTYDSAGKRFLISSVHEHKILSCDLSGACLDFIQQPDAIFAIRADVPRHVLWATTADMNAGKSALLEFDLMTRKLLQRLEAPDDGAKHTMGDMAVTANGDLFVSDGLSGDVFTLPHKAGSLMEKLAPAGVFLSPQTPAVSTDGKLLYVPDYVAGIAVIRLSDRHIEWMRSTVPAALEGIDGLYNVGGRFIAVQNGVQPPRIAELHFSANNVLDRVTVLEANWPGFGQPTHGVQVGREFYFIVNSGWDRSDDGVAMKAGSPAELWRLPL